MKSKIRQQIGEYVRQIRQKSRAVRSLNVQSTTLKLLALGLAALMGVLVLGGIQAIARVNSDTGANPDLVSRPAPQLLPGLAPAPSATKPTTPFKSDFESPRFSVAQRTASPTPQGSQSKEGGEVRGPASRRNNRPADRPAAPSPQPSVRPSPSPTPQARPSASPSPQARPAAPARPPVAAPPAAAPPAATAPLAPITPVFASPNPALSANMPAMANAPADPTNYGDRYATDINGRPVNNQLLVVLHETVGSASSAVNTMQTPHPNEDDQVSYHSIIKRDGTVIYVVAPERRAFGAGNSVFNGANGPEAVKTHKDFPPSVNNFAYHISLESPSDGRGSGQTHSGYSAEQYRSLAWLIIWTNVPFDRVTTHRAVDQSGSRIDPRSFDGQLLAGQLQDYMRASSQQ
jgi:N-acetyl-anhydromuramyl-L-alanine amidase AmpD